MVAGGVLAGATIPMKLRATKPMPFDGKRLIYGGFEVIVSA